MKKKSKRVSYLIRNLLKPKWIMGSLFTFILFGMLQANPLSLQTTVDLQVSNASLESIIWQLNKQTAFTFLYSSDDIENIQGVNLTVENETLENVLDKCLKENGLDYTVNENTVIIMKSEAIDNYVELESIEIKGKVTDSEGNPLPGATVLEEGTLNGVTTNKEGNFTLKVTSSASKIKVSYIGFKTQTIPVGNRTEIKVVLEESAESLEEVVITGMFKKKVETYTGSVTTIGKDELEKFGTRNVISTLKNIDPSFNIVESNIYGSDPNRLPEINIRGTSSLPTVQELQNNTKAHINTPLIILDGFEISLEKLTTLNDEELASITLLKDASATAIYGSRGANGVVVITRKEPEAGKLKLTYNSKVTIEVPDLSGYKLLNAREKLELEKAAGYYDTPLAMLDLMLRERYSKLLKQTTEGVSTDWLSKPLRTGVGQRHNFRLEGGDSKFRYAATIDYNEINGVMKGSNKRAFNGSISLAYYHHNLVFRNQLSIGLNKGNESPYGSFSDYVPLNPYWTPYDENGNMKRFLDTFDEFFKNKEYPSNPLYNATLNTVNSNNYKDIVNNFSVEWKIMDGLTFRTKVGLSLVERDSDFFLPAQHTMFENYKGEDLFRKGMYRYGTGEDFNWDLNTTISYSKIFADKHQVYIGLDYGMTERSSKFYNFTIEGFAHESLDFLTMGLQYLKDGKPSGGETNTRSVGFTGNMNYSYDDRYFVDFSYRIDGSSQFGTNKRFAPFWSVGAGWNLHKEAWFNSITFIKRFKLKASYGVTGSQQFSAYQALSTYQYYTSSRYLDLRGLALLGLGNEDLEWQKTKQYNLGFDTELFEGKIQFSADFYLKKTSNLLSQIDIPLSNGFPSYTENIGAVENKGFELMLGVNLINKKDFYWLVRTRIAHNKSKIVKLSDAIKQQNKNVMNRVTSVPNNLLFEGDPINAIYVVPSLGIDPNTGNEVFMNRKGEITYTWDARDRVFAGISEPKYRGTMTSYMRFKNFELNLAFGYSWGGQKYNQTLIDRVENADLLYNVDRRVYESSWRKQGDIAFFKDIRDKYAETYYSSRFVQDEAIFQLQSAELSYKLQNDWLKSRGIRQLKFSCNSANLFYLSTIKRERGLAYPFSRSVSFKVLAIF